MKPLVQQYPYKEQLKVKLRLNFIMIYTKTENGIKTTIAKIFLRFYKILTHFFFCQKNPKNSNQTLLL